MTEAEELKIRAQAEAEALNRVLSSLLGSFVMNAGEVAVLRAKLKEQEPPAEH